MSWSITQGSSPSLRILTKIRPGLRLSAQSRQPRKSSGSAQQMKCVLKRSNLSHSLRQAVARSAFCIAQTYTQTQTAQKENKMTRTQMNELQARIAFLEDYMADLRANFAEHDCFDPDFEDDRYLYRQANDELGTAMLQLRNARTVLC